MVVEVDRQTTKFSGYTVYKIHSLQNNTYIIIQNKATHNNACMGSVEVPEEMDTFLRSCFGKPLNSVGSQSPRQKQNLVIQGSNLVGQP